HGRQVRVVEIEGVGRCAENHCRVARCPRDLLRGRLAQAAQDAAGDVDERAFRFLANVRWQLVPLRVDDEAREAGGYSALTPAVLTTGAHFAISSRMNAANASGVPRIGSAPCACRRSATSFESRICATVRFSFSITGRG